MFQYVQSWDQLLHMATADSFDLDMNAYYTFTF